MMAAFRAAILKPQGCSSHLKTTFFHSTPVLQRKDKSNSEFRKKKLSRSREKQDLRRNANAFAEHLFGIWSDGFDYSDKHTSWFGKQYYRVCKRNRTGRYIPQRLDKKELMMDLKLNTFYVVHWVDPIKRGNLDGELVISMGQTPMKRANFAKHIAITGLYL